MVRQNAAYEERLRANRAARAREAEEAAAAKVRAERQAALRQLPRPTTLQRKETSIQLHLRRDKRDSADAVVRLRRHMVTSCMAVLLWLCLGSGCMEGSVLQSPGARWTEILWVEIRWSGLDVSSEGMIVAQQPAEAQPLGLSHAHCINLLPHEAAVLAAAMCTALLKPLRARSLMA